MTGLRPRHYADAIRRGAMTCEDVPADMRATVRAHLDGATLREDGMIAAYANAVAGLPTRNDRGFALAKVPEHLRERVRAKAVEKFNLKENNNADAP